MMPLATTDGKKTREVKWEYNLDKKKLIKKKKNCWKSLYVYK